MRLSAAAGEHHVGVAAGDQAERLADGLRAGDARGHDRVVRPLAVERHRDVRRRHVRQVLQKPEREQRRSRRSGRRSCVGVELARPPGRPGRAAGRVRRRSIGTRPVPMTTPSRSGFERRQVEPAVGDGQPGGPDAEPGGPAHDLHRLAEVVRDDTVRGRSRALRRRRGWDDWMRRTSGSARCRCARPRSRPRTRPCPPRSGRRRPIPEMTTLRMTSPRSAWPHTSRGADSLC